MGLSSLEMIAAFGYDFRCAIKRVRHFGKGKSMIFENGIFRLEAWEEGEKLNIRFTPLCDLQELSEQQRTQMQQALLCLLDNRAVLMP